MSRTRTRFQLANFTTFSTASTQHSSLFWDITQTPAYSLIYSSYNRQFYENMDVQGNQLDEHFCDSQYSATCSGLISVLLGVVQLPLGYEVLHWPQRDSLTETSVITPAGFFFQAYTVLRLQDFPGLSCLISSDMQIQPPASDCAVQDHRQNVNHGGSQLFLSAYALRLNWTTPKTLFPQHGFSMAFARRYSKGAFHQQSIQHLQGDSSRHRNSLETE